MRELASTIKTSLDTLAAEYAQRLHEIGGYANLPERDRLDGARYDLDLIATCLEAEDNGAFLEFIRDRAGERLVQAFEAGSLQQALGAFEETLLPLVTTVEAAQFLWRALSQARNIVHHRAGEMLREAEGALHESERRYRQIVEKAIDIIYTIDPQGYFTYVSPASERLTGYPEGELVGIHFTNLISPEWKEQVLAFYLNQFRERVPETILQFPIVTRSGKEKWVEQTAALVADGDRVAGFQSIVRDITERKRLEQQLQESEQKFREMIDRALVGIFRTTPAGQIVEANPAVLNLLRFDSIEQANQAGLLNMVVDPADWERLLEMTRQGPVTGFETRFRRGDGEIIAISISANLIRDEQGAPLLIEATLEDVTERNRLERLRGLERLYGAASREAWSQTGKGAAGGYLFDRTAVRPAGDLWASEIGLAVQRGTLALPAGGDNAAAVAPLSVRGELLGVLGVQQEPDNPLSADDLALVELVSEQTAQALESARLFAESQSRARDLAVLNDMGRALTGTLDLEAIIESTRHFATQLVDTTNFYVALYDAEHDEISFPLYIDGETTRFNVAARRAGNGMTEHVLRTRQPLLIKEDIATVQAELGIESIGQSGQSWLGVPMIVGERPIGVIAVQSYTTPRVYDEHDRDLLVAVASQAAIAIQNARLFSDQQRTAGLLGERLKQLDCLSDIGRRAQEAPPLPEFLEWVAERIPAAMRYPDLCLAAVEFEGHLYGAPAAIAGDHVGTAGRQGHGRQQAAYHPGAKRSGQAAQAEEESPPSRLARPAGELRSGGVPCQMVQGLRIGDETVGHVYVIYPEEQQFADEESALLGDIVRRVSGYVENRRLLEEAEKASRRLAEERALLRTLIDSLPDPTFVKDRNSRFTLSNVAHVQILGAASEEEIVGQTDFDRFPQELAAGFYADEQEVMRSGQPLINREEYVVDEAGGRRWLWTTKVPLRDDQGRITGLVGINHDITERKWAEESLRESESRLSAILESIQTGVVILDPGTHTVVDVNPIAAKLIGAPREQIVGSVCHKFICPAEVGRCPITDLGQTVDNSERVLLTADGERRSIIKTVSPIMLGGRQHLLESFTDITARKQAEDVLQRRGAQLECLSDIGQRIGEAQPAPEFLQWVAERIPAAFQYPDLCLAAIEFEGATYGAAEALQQPRQIVQSLRRGKEILGRLCVAYRQERDFLDEESALLGDMARRVSGYIENRRLFEQTQAALAEVEATHRRYLQTQWQSYFQQRTDLRQAGFVFERAGATEGSPEQGRGDASPVLDRLGDVRAVPDLWRPEMEQALNAAAPARVEAGDIPPDPGDGGDGTPAFQRAGLAVPIVLRGQPIGVLGIENPDATGRWSDEEVTLLEEVGLQLALALENARLFEETQRRAERERLITGITARIRSSTDMLGVLETTATELGKALGTSRVLVRLAPMSESTPLEPGDGGQESAILGERSESRRSSSEDRSASGHAGPRVPDASAGPAAVDIQPTPDEKEE
jgi:PAS domain S-box-containing protein